MTIRMTAKNEIVLYGTVGVDFWDEDYFTARQVREALAGMSGDITVRLNSGGGIADEGQAIYRSLAEHDGHVRIVIDGAAASAASLIAMAGDEIIMPAGSWMLIHDPANAGTFGRGTQNDHEHMARMLDVIASSYAGVYAAKAGITVEQARQIMRDETVYGPADAFAMGFATQVDEMATASAAAPFPYHVYANAPKGLAGVPGARPAKEAVMAMVAGMPRVSGEDVSMTDKPNPAAGSPAAEDVKDKAATVEPKRDAQETMAQAVGAERQRIVAVLGPTISQDSYEVGPEFRERFILAEPGSDAYFRASSNGGKFMFDLPAYIIARLERSGVQASSLGHCTYVDEARFYSYRRSVHKSEPDYGRLMSAITLEDD